MIQIAVPCIGEEEIQAIKTPLLSGWLTQGPKVSEFEKAFAAYHECNYASAVTSCTTALHLGLHVLGIKPGDEVIVPSFTWVATANAVKYCGAEPVIVDSCLDTYNIDPIEIKKAITPKTKAIIPVHLFGLCADIDEIRNVASGIPLLEDAACAIGAKYKNKFAGTLGEMGAFSFHPRKIVTTGEGGMLSSNNEDLINLCHMLKSHGASISEEIRHFGSKPYLMADYNVVGYNYRMTDIQAAVGIEQLKKLDNFIAERQKWAKFYTENLASVKWLKTPFIPDYAFHSFQSFVCIVDCTKTKFTRNEIMEQLFQKGISTRPGTHSLTTLGVYKHHNECKNAKFLQDNTMAIPLHNKMTEEDYHYVVEIIKSI